MRIVIAAAAALGVVVASASVARAEDPPEDALTDSTIRWEGSLGGCFESDKLHGVDFGGGGVCGSAGLRTHRWGVLADYRLMSVGWGPAPSSSTMTDASGAGSGAASVPTGEVGGHAQRFGAAARVNVLSLGESKVDGFMHEFFEVFVEGTAGIEVIDWRDGGQLTRTDVGLGGGIRLYGIRYREHRTIGIIARIDETFARRPPTYDNTATCAGPCDIATRPSAWDTGVIGMIALVISQ